MKCKVMFQQWYLALFEDMVDEIKKKKLWPHQSINRQLQKCVRRHTENMYHRQKTH